MSIRPYFSARYPFLWIQTTEEERAIRNQRNQIKKEVNFFSWDIADGFKALVPNGSENSWTWKQAEEEKTESPNVALEKIVTYPKNSVFYLKDFHKYFQEITITRKSLNLKETLKATARMIIFISALPHGDLPPEIKNDITPYASPLPNQEELKDTVLRTVTDNGLAIPTDSELEKISNALIGLTEEGAENALSFSLVTTKKIDPKILIAEKARFIKGKGLNYSEYKENMEDLAGLDVIKKYVLKAAPKKGSNALLLFGVPGCGKSHLSKALGNALQWPVITGSFSTMRGKYQGETEQTLENNLQTIRAIGRCIFFVDEFEKCIAGAEGGSDSDAGAGSRIVGRILQEMEDKAQSENPAYWIFTTNNLKPLLETSGGALLRRFDACFFLDFPTKKERREIVKIWNKKLNVSIPEDFNTDGMTGADINKLARTMNLLECSAEEARKYVIPTSTVLGERIKEMRIQAKTTCINASLPETDETPTGRKLDI